MKAESGNWLYILLSAVFIILSLIGNKDKKKQTSSTQPINDDYEPSRPPERHWPKSLDDVLTEVLDLPKQQQVVITENKPWAREEVLDMPQNSYEKIGEEAQSLETIEEEAFSYETPAELSKSRVQRVESLKEPEVREPQLVFSDFDLREGIIYTEILNRKYF
jgi:hypothetical protein